MALRLSFWCIVLVCSLSSMTCNQVVVSNTQGWCKVRGIPVQVNQNMYNLFTEVVQKGAETNPVYDICIMAYNDTAISPNTIDCIYSRPNEYVRAIISVSRENDIIPKNPDSGEQVRFDITDVAGNPTEQLKFDVSLVIGSKAAGVEEDFTQTATRGAVAVGWAEFLNHKLVYIDLIFELEFVDGLDKLGELNGYITGSID